MKKILLSILRSTAILIGALIALIVVFGFYFKITTIFDKTKDKLKYDAVARTGVPIVEAIYGYRNVTELYPETVDDLKRVSSLQLDATLWLYMWGNGFARLEYIGKAVPHGLIYQFSGPHPGWLIANRLFEDAPAIVDAPVSIPSPPERSPGEKHRLIVQEIERRIARDGTNVTHHKGLISHCINAGDLPGALAAAMRMHERKMDPWWELQILARLLHRMQKDNWAEREMRASAEQSHEFIPFFYLAWYYREAGETEAALHTIGKASASPFRLMSRDHYVDDYYFWLAATYAYQERRPDLVLAVCDVWKATCARRGWGASNPDALRAAAFLAQGDAIQAKRNIKQAIHEKGDQAIWAENLDALSSAIQRGDTEFRWIPGSYPELDGYELLITYE